MYSARTYYNILRESKTEEEYKEALVRVLTEMFDATIERIERGGKNVISCVLQMNQKWDSIRAIADNNPIFIGDTKMVLKPHGFMHSFSEVHKEYGFDYKKFCKDLHLEPEPDLEEIQADAENEAANLFHIVIPFEELTLGNIHGELLSIYAVIGGMHKIQMPIDVYKPLVYRARLLEYWVKNGNINLDDVEPFNKDPEAFFKDKEDN